MGIAMAGSLSQGLIESFSPCLKGKKLPDRRRYVPAIIFQIPAIELQTTPRIEAVVERDRSSIEPAKAFNKAVEDMIRVQIAFLQEATACTFPENKQSIA